MTDRILLGFDGTTDGEVVAVKVTTTPAQRLELLTLTPDVPKDELRVAIAELVHDIATRLAELEQQAEADRSEPLPDPLRGLPRTINGRTVRAE
ncbi:hypothetical protein [Kribbella sp. CA-293567]|uniref:hypothetical protein n=1 Tax=Kribbella sp. CA-293567 TaxID=3002436 RepID=UPI0022DCE73F|nr:hypothetical protein [Kribbella sp. CA-293567]WBQ03005.1 hypothetical protein OX958_23845 [Kribbella sp. CA-293567]